MLDHISHLKWSTFKYWIAVLLLYLNMGLPISRWLGNSIGNDFIDIVVRGSDLALIILAGWVGIVFCLVLIFPMGAIWSWIRSTNTIWSWYKERKGVTLLMLCCLTPFIFFDHLLVSFSLPVVTYTLLKNSKLNTAMIAWYWLNTLSALYQVITQQSIGLWLLGESLLAKNIAGLARIELFDRLILRGYGLTPHPNILAAIGLLGVLFLPKKWYAQVPSYLMILLSFSRSGLLGLSILGISWIFKRFKNNFQRTSIIATVITLVVLSSPLLVRSSDRLRIQNLELWWSWISQRSIWGVLGGVGVGQYSLALQENFPRLEVWQYEPVHSIPLLLVSELGLTLPLLFAILIAVIKYKTNIQKETHDSETEIDIR